MTKKSRKYALLGGVKVSSEQLSEWGKTGGRPRKYASVAEKSRAQRLRKKQERFGSEAQLEGRKIYGMETVKKFLTCPSCGKVDYDLEKYFTEKGEYIPESYWFDTVKMKKMNVRANEYHCTRCYRVFSFSGLEVQEKRIGTARAGTSKERQQRRKERETESKSKK